MTQNMGRHKTYSIECPECGSPDRVLRKGQYKSKGQGFFRVKCHACNISFTRYIPEEANGAPMPPERPKKPVNQGECHPQAKLSANNVRDIVALKDSGSRVWELAERYQVSEASIVAILTGQTWASVTGIERKTQKGMGRYKRRGV